jgi:hypothetical protein
MLGLMLGVFRTMPAAETTRRRYAFAVLVFAFLLLLCHVSTSLPKHDIAIRSQTAQVTPALGD